MNAASISLFSIFIAASSFMPKEAAAQDTAAQDIAAGERLFRTRCSSCHSIEAGQNRIGPHLDGVVGRKAGSVDGARYSQGMRDLGIIWDVAQIETFLADPRGMVKGTTMTVAVPREAERVAIAAYLREATKTN